MTTRLFVRHYAPTSMYPGVARSESWLVPGETRAIVRYVYADFPGDNETTTIKASKFWPELAW